MLHDKKETNTKNFPKLVSSKFGAFGTEIEIRIVVNKEVEIELANKDLKQVQTIYDVFTKIFSRFDANSEIVKLNNNLGNFNAVSDEMLKAAVSCLKFNEDTDGMFDPRIIDTLESVGYKNDFKRGEFTFSGHRCRACEKSLSDDLKIKDGKIFFGARMDFTGMVKGFATDNVAEFLLKNGWTNFLVDSGGDMFLNGSDQAGDAWLIDIDGISHKKLMFALSRNGLATSGISKRKWEIDGQKFHHLINPKKPENFAFDLKTVTVISPTTEEADVWAKTLFLMGKESAIIYARENEIAAVILDYRGSGWISPRAKDFLYH